PHVLGGCSGHLKAYEEQYSNRSCKDAYPQDLLRIGSRCGESPSQNAKEQARGNPCIEPVHPTVAAEMRALNAMIGKPYDHVSYRDIVLQKTLHDSALVSRR